MKIWQLIVAGVVVHLILFYSIFDIYFTSPLVHGMTPISPLTGTPSRRLVLFVADGLRADKFYELDKNGYSRAPYLRSIIEEHGAWGVSHTRVPTESRPGHVALIAGFYEDVSAVAKGWKENPVEFDSVFNKSRHTWSWGSPDILPMFAKGASGNHITINCYPAEINDFAGSDMTLLDTWVFDHVKDFFDSASTNETLQRALDQDQLVFFLHLLGIDTHGHSDKPHSQEYLNNIKLVDRGIKEMVSLIEDYYNHDSKTSYILTADHGMTDWGSHGAGHAQETLTPFVTWGSGVRHALLSSTCGIDTDTFCADWQLQTVKRSDIEQADIAPLMAYLVGIPLPVNSVGTLPIDVLNATDDVKAEALLANANQIIEQFQVKMDQIKERTISATFRPFQELGEAEKLQAIKHIKGLIHAGQLQEAIRETHILIQKALKGLRYYQTYDRMFLGVSIVLGFLGWMVYVLYLILQEHTQVGPLYRSIQAELQQRPSVTAAVFTVIGLCVAALLYIQSLPLTNYLYCLLPVALWCKACEKWGLMRISILYALHKEQLWGILVCVAICIGGLEVSIRSFYNRELLSMGLLLAAVFPYAGKLMPGVHFNITPATAAGWSFSCLLVGLFPLLPVVGRETQYELVLICGVFAFIVGSILFHSLSEGFTQVISKCAFIMQLFLVCLSTLVVYVVSCSIEQRKGLPLWCQVCSWAILGLSFILPLFSPTTIRERLLSLTLSFFAVYLLLSIIYEAFFLISLATLLYVWLKMEHDLCEPSEEERFEQVDFRQDVSVNGNMSGPTFNRHVELHDLRRAFIYVFFNLTAFFGTGNIASINSFNPASVYCFLTVFNPWLMGALMMLKNVIPFLMVTCAFRGIHVLTKAPLRLLFLIVFIMSDFMGLRFFFMVRDYGSWLEIGTTISHYVIVMTMIIFLLLLTGLSHALTCWRVPVPGKREKTY